MSTTRQRPQDASLVQIPKSLVKKVIEEVSTYSSEDLRQHVHRSFNGQHALLAFATKMSEALTSSIESSALIAIASISKMFEEHRGFRPPQIDTDIIDHFFQQNE